MTAAGEWVKNITKKSGCQGKTLDTLFLFIVVKSSLADGSSLTGDHRTTDTGMRISLLGLFIAKLLIERMGGSIEAIFIDNKLQIKITFAK